ncbi:MAG TPA: hypothetical protein PK823_16530 [Novosphingobium sp.]|nr:hypothetical protein [Novosphingobium sp.]
MWADLETALHEAPLFQVERPDDRKRLTELHRVCMFRSLLQYSPGVHVHAIPNAGKRGPAAQRQAKKEGMVAGVFDLCVTWRGAGVAWVEFKGFDARGTAGKLSQAQIDWGNSQFRIGHNVACFFSPERAVEWLQGLGAPVVGRVAA